MSDKNGGAAFPCSGYQEWQPQAGMTLRDYFAAKVVSGFSVDMAKRSVDDFDRLIPAMARISYAVADAMLKERSK